MRLDHLVLVEQRELARHFEHALDHEHDVGPAGVIFVEAERDVVLQRPGQDAIAELGHLHAVANDDGVLADEIDTTDVAVEVDPHAWPIQPRRHLLDVGGFSGAVVAGNDHAPVLGEAGENGERGRLVEAVVRVDVWSMLVRLRIGRHFHVAVDAEELSDRHLHVGESGDLLCCDAH